MADEKIEKKKQEDFALIQSIWHILRDYGNLTTDKMNDGRWEEVIEAGNEIAKQGGYAREIATATLAELERRATHDNR